MIHVSNTLLLLWKMRVEPEQISISSEALKRRHEVQNPPAGRIALAAAGLILVTVVCMAMIWILLGLWLRKRPFDSDFHSRGFIIAPNQEPFVRFPKPNLQMNPQVDLATFRAQEDAELNGYGWINRTSGVVRIPIERAMELIAQRGLPTRTNAEASVGKSEIQLIRERSEQR
jgi:hypothetical protein